MKNVKSMTLAELKAELATIEAAPKSVTSQYRINKLRKEISKLMKMPNPEGKRDYGR